MMNLNQVTLPVDDMDKATGFYRRLGFVQIVDSPHYARFESQQGQSTFSLALENEAFKNGAVIYFENENLDELVDQLSGAREAIESTLLSSECTRMLTLQAPNQVEREDRRVQLADRILGCETHSVHRRLRKGVTR